MKRLSDMDRKELVRHARKSKRHLAELLGAYEALLRFNASLIVEVARLRDRVPFEPGRVGFVQRVDKDKLS